MPNLIGAATGRARSVAWPALDYDLIMSADVRHDAQDLEPELGGAGKAPAKKPLAEFLAEFEERLAKHPDEAATGALRLVEERAAGLRHSRAEASPSLNAPTEMETPARASAATEIEAMAHQAAPSPAPERAPDVGGPTVESSAGSGQAERSGESRRIRGRRRKHRHRAH